MTPTETIKPITPDSVKAKPEVWLSKVVME